jgi:hypothetical protein
VASFGTPLHFLECSIGYPEPNHAHLLVVGVLRK